MRRLCFGWHVDTTRHVRREPLPFSGGLPPSNATGAAQLRRSFARTLNKGFMVVGEATARLFDCDPDASEMADLRRLAAAAPAEMLAERINRDFDALILGMAYEVNSTANYDRLLPLLEQISIPVITLGLSIETLELTPEALHSSVMPLLRLLSERAVLFGVRADSTKDWLEQYGIGGGVPLGCPSLHLYPNAIVGLSPVTRSADEATFATGGYLLRDHERGRKLSALFERRRASYVLQDEIFTLSDAEIDEIRFNESRREFMADDLNRIAEARLDHRPPFSRYFLFDEMSAWRQCLAWHDAYIGDRFHGATTALQAGRPAVVICRDVRSQELAEFYGLPNLSLDDASDLGLDGILDHMLSDDRLDRLKDRYRQRHESFASALGRCGLRLNASI